MSLQRGTWYKASCCHLLEPHLQCARPESRDSSDQASPRMSASPGTWELSEGLCRRHTVLPPRGVQHQNKRVSFELNVFIDSTHRIILHVSGFF